MMKILETVRAKDQVGCNQSYQTFWTQQANIETFKVISSQY